MIATLICHGHAWAMVYLVLSKSGKMEKNVVSASVSEMKHSAQDTLDKKGVLDFIVKTYLKLNIQFAYAVLPG